MASLQSREIERFIQNPDFSRTVILIYGPDSGLVSERADMLAAKSSVDLKDPFCLIRMNADDAASDPSCIADEAHTIGMFEGKRLIRVSGSTRRDLAKAVKPVLETPSEDAIILIEAGELTKSSALRKMLEAHPSSLCIPCYQDTDAALEQLIEEEIVKAGLAIDRENKQLLKSVLGDNRMISRNELKKLALYCNGKDSISADDIHDSVGDASKLVLDDVIDAAATGETQRLQQVLPKALESGNRADMILAATLRHFQLLQAGRAKIEHNRQNPGAVMASFRPPIHFSRKDRVASALSIWPLARLNRALTRLDKAMFEARSQDSISHSLAGTALLALALEARQLRNN